MLSQQPLVALRSNSVEHVITCYWLISCNKVFHGPNYLTVATTSLATISLTMISLKSYVRSETPKTVATIVCQGCSTTCIRPGTTGYEYNHKPSVKKATNIWHISTYYRFIYCWSIGEVRHTTQGTTKSKTYSCEAASWLKTITGISKIWLDFQSTHNSKNIYS